jgi:ribosomal protein S3
METVIDSKPFRRILSYYPYFTESSGSYLYHITKVDAFENENGIRVVIEIHLPGFLIGKQGKQIADIQKLMSEECEKPVKIEIVESQLFSNLYD